MESGDSPCLLAGSRWEAPRRVGTWGSLPASGRNRVPSGRLVETLLVWDAYWGVGIV